MNQNHIDDRWRQCHWEESLKIKDNTGEEPSQQSERLRAAEFERRAQLSPSSGTGWNSTAFGAWSGGHLFRPVFPTEAGVSPASGILAQVVAREQAAIALEG